MIKNIISAHKIYPLEDLIQHNNVSILKNPNGTNRMVDGQCQISAEHDLEAIHDFLNNYSDKIATHRLYKKEIERLVLWCVYACEKPLSSLGKDEILKYEEFLKNPQPSHIWCGKSGGRGRKRGDEFWRPFTGPLNHNSRRTAFAVIKTLFEYLTAARYLAFNPFSLIKRLQKNSFSSLEERKIVIYERILHQNEWHAFLDTLEEMPNQSPHEKDEKVRLKFIIVMLYFLGLRIQDLTTHCWNAFRKMDNDWWFYVKGKGGKLGRIPVNDELIAQVITYRQHLGCQHLTPLADDLNCLVANWQTGQPLTARYINKLIKKLALATAEKFNDQPLIQQKFKKVSAHWLRHLSASMQARAGINLHHIKTNLRHTSLATTEIYLHDLDNERHLLMKKLTLR
jgi:integrase